MNTKQVADIKPEHVKRFVKLATQLDKLMREICKYNPVAELYVEDSWHFNLMKGPTHDDSYKQRPIHDNVVECVDVYRSSGGGW